MISNFILGYLIIIVVYTVTLILKKDKDTLFKILMVVIAPGFGFLFLLLAKFLSRSDQNLPEAEKRVDDLFARAGGMAVVTSSDNLITPDILSLSDILHHNDVDTKRKRFFKEISGDINKTSYFLKKALKDHDCEIAHYAAALITGTKQKLMTDFGIARDMLNNQPRKEEDLAFYIETLLCCVNSGLFSEDDVKKKREELSQSFDEYFEILEESNENYSYERINNEMFLGNKEKAYEISKEFLKKFKKSEKPYIALMKVLNSVGNRKIFYKIVNYVKSNNIVCSKDFHDIIIFWENAA